MLCKILYISSFVSEREEVPAKGLESREEGSSFQENTGGCRLAVLGDMLEHL